MSTPEYQRLVADTDPDVVEVEEDTHVVPTTYGNLTVATQGSKEAREKFTLLTCHDVGLNHRSCFSGFFSHPGTLLGRVYKVSYKG